jgi:serine/threonine protein kinase
MSSDAARNTVTRSVVAAASVNSAGEETAATGGASTFDAGDRPPFGPPADASELGRLGKYRIQRELGRGGMGAVYLAFDERLQRKVALKVMLPKAAANATAKDRFLREARAAAQISSDHVVNIYEADEIAGVPFIALQYLQGYPLDEYLKKKGLPTVPQVIRLGRETALGLAAAHKLGLVHRDIKPGNVWLEAPGGRVKILDFGLAKPVVSREQHELTASGAIVGTPAYMAPEQGMGRNVDGRADLFSLGCMLYRLTAGRLPFDGPTLMAILTAIATEEPPPVRTLNPQVPEPLADLIRRLLAKNPADRPATAADVVKELDAIGTAAKKPAAAVDPDAPTVAAAQVVYTPMAVTVPPNNPFEYLVGEGSSVEDRPSAVEPARAAGKRGKAPPWPLIAAAAGFAFLLLAGLAGIIIKITNKDGTVTEIKVPDGSKIEVSKDGKPLVAVGPDAKVTTPNPPTPHAPTSPPPVNATVVNRETGLPAGKSGLRFEPGDVAVAAKVPVRPTTVVTIEAWLTFEAVQEVGARELIGTPNGNVNTTDNRLTFYTFHGGAVSSDLIPKGRRVHVAAVNDGKKRYLYLGGKRVGESEDAGTPVPDNEQQAAGERFTRIALGSDHFTGTIDAVRVSTTARYDKEFTPPAEFQKDADTFALYLFDEGQGDTLKDSSGNGYHAKITGAKWVKGVAPDRKAAAWVLSIGGRVKLNDQVQPNLTAETELPKEPFQLTGVSLLREVEPRTGDAGLAAFKGCRHLTELVLHSDRVSDVGLAYFGECTTLTTLDLSSWAATDAGLAHFKNNKGLTSLGLASDKFTDAGLADFGECKDLTYLNLYSTRLTDAGLARFKSCTKLNQLWLMNSAVSDASVELLRGFPELRSLHLKATKFTKAGVEKLAVALPKCKIAWDGGVIEPRVAADPDRAVAEWVLSVKGKCVVQVNDKNTQCTAPDQLPAGEFKLIDASIAFEHATDANVARFAGLRNLASLNLVGGTVTDQGVAKLRDLPRLMYLNLHGTKVTDAGLPGPKDLPELNALILTDTAVTDTGLAALTKLPKLQGLVLNHTAVTDEGLQHLRAAPGLTQVSVLKTKVTEAGVKRLAAALPKCKVEWDGGTIGPK